MKQEKKKAKNWIKSNRLELIPSDESHFKPLKYVFTMRNDSTFRFLHFPTPARHRTRVLSGPPPYPKRKATASVRIRFTVKRSLPALARILQNTPTCLHPREKHGERKKDVESAEREAEEEEPRRT